VELASQIHVRIHDEMRITVFCGDHHRVIEQSGLNQHRATLWPCSSSHESTSTTNQSECRNLCSCSRGQEMMIKIEKCDEFGMANSRQDRFCPH
jgi:hypothetical protein